MEMYKDNEEDIEIQIAYEKDVKTTILRKDKNEHINENILPERTTKNKRLRGESLQALEKQAKKIKN